MSASNAGWSQKSLRSYVISFVLCLAITLAAFGIVKDTSVSKTTVYALLTSFAILQMIIQAICFLGLNGDKDGRWNVLPFLFTILIIVFVVGGSLWIMHNLSVLMMGYMG